eukprot:SAG31_NODE_8139_length_1513_cov_2.099717_3_plen_166_part_01
MGVQVRARFSGPKAWVDLHIEVDPKTTVSAAHATAAFVRQQLLVELPELADVIVHVDPERETDEDSQTDALLMDNKQHFLPRCIRTPQSVKAEAEKVISSCEGVERLSHIAVHFLPLPPVQENRQQSDLDDAGQSNDGVSVLVEMTIEVNRQLTVAQAGLIAANAR